MTFDMSKLKKEEQAIFRLRELYGRYGYSQYKMSKFEEYDLYVRNKNFLISDSVITFTDTNGKLLALKPDVTLSIVKNSKDAPGQVQKLYYNENVYRISGRSQSYKEIMQVGLECIGDIDAYCIGEVLSLACQSLGAIEENYILSVSHVGLLSLVLDRIGISQKSRRSLLECVAQKNTHEAELLCQTEGLSNRSIALLHGLTDCSGDVISAFQRLYALQADEEWQSTVRAFEESVAGLPLEHLRIDFSVINDLRYYNGTVFQGYVAGVPERILSGGQYDNLMHRMEKKAGAIGFAIYLDRLESLDTEKAQYDVDTVLLYGDGIAPTQVRSAVEELTQRGLRVLAQKSIPEKLRYRQLLRITESGVQTLETNA